MIALLLGIALVATGVVIVALLPSWRARRDALVGVNTVDHLLTSRHGVVPTFDPIGNMEHAHIAGDLQGAPIDELRESIQRVEDEQTLHETSFALTVKLGACYVAEVLGCTLLFRGLGFNGIERLVPAILFASFLFWITSETKRQGGAA